MLDAGWLEKERKKKKTLKNNRMKVVLCHNSCSKLPSTVNAARELQLVPLFSRFGLLIQALSGFSTSLTSLRTDSLRVHSPIVIQTSGECKVARGVPFH